MEEDPPDKALVRFGVDPDYQIIRFLHHVDRPVFGRDLKPYVGMLQRKPGGQLAHRGLGEEQRRTNSKPAPRVMPSRGDRGGRLVEFGQQLAGPLEQRPSFLGQLQYPRAALEQAQIEARFELRDAARQGRLGPPGSAGGFPEASMAGDKVEIGEREKVHVFHQ